MSVWFLNRLSMTMWATLQKWRKEPPTDLGLGLFNLWIWADSGQDRTEYDLKIRYQPISNEQPRFSVFCGQTPDSVFPTCSVWTNWKQKKRVKLSFNSLISSALALRSRMGLHRVRWNCWKYYDKGRKIYFFEDELVKWVEQSRVKTFAEEFSRNKRQY